MLKKSSKSLVVLGSEHVGKTCFLAGLGIMSEGDRDSDILLSSKNDTKQFIYQLTSTLRSQTWPAQTTSDDTITADLFYDSYIFKLKLVEYAGEHFRESYAQGKHLPQNLLEALQHADYLLIALDPNVELNLSHNKSESIDENERYYQRIDSLLEAVHQLLIDRGSKSLEVAVVILKADLINENICNPKRAMRYLKKTTPFFFKRLESHFPKFHAFAVSSVGNTERDQSGNIIPARELNPWGYNEIFDWIIQDTKKKRRKPLITRFCISLLSLLIICAVYVGYIKIKDIYTTNQLDGIFRRGIEPNQISEIERVVRSAPTETIQNIIDEILDKSEHFLLQSSISRKDAESLFNGLRILGNANDPYRIHEIQSAISDWQQKLESIDFTSIQLSMKQNLDFKDQASEFLDKYPNSRYRSQIIEWLEQQNTQERAQDARKISLLRANSNGALSQKVNQIFNFLDDHPNVDFSSDIREAAYVAERLKQNIENNSVLVELVSVGELASEGFISLKIYISGITEPIIDIQSNYATTVYSFEDNKIHTIPWTIGKEITVELWIDWGWRWSNKKFASKVITDDLSLAFLDGEIFLDGFDGNEQYFLQNKPVLKCNVVDMEDQDWTLLKDWISPGSKWSQFTDE